MLLIKIYLLINSNFKERGGATLWHCEFKKGWLILRKEAFLLKSLVKANVFKAQKSKILRLK
jgi:hypothetical protein